MDWQNYFQEKGYYGDELLDLMDVVQDLIRYGVQLNEGGTATLYHGTTLEKAKMILEEQVLFGLEDGLFFSTSAVGEVLGYGAIVLEVAVPIDQLILDDEFKKEQHYRVPVRARDRVPFQIKLK